MRNPIDTLKAARETVVGYKKDYQGRSDTLTQTIASHAHQIAALDLEIAGFDAAIAKLELPVKARIAGKFVIGDLVRHLGFFATCGVGQVMELYPNSKLIRIRWSPWNEADVFSDNLRHAVSE